MRISPPIGVKTVRHLGRRHVASPRSCESTAELVLCRAAQSSDGKALDAQVRDANLGCQLVKRSIARSVEKLPPLLLARGPACTKRPDVTNHRQGQAFTNPLDLHLHDQDAGLNGPV